MFAISTALTPSIITGIFGLFGTIASAVIGRDFLNRRLLKEQLSIAQADIAFLLQVEELHCAKLKSHGFQSSKLRLRADAKDKGFTWSGRFTPSRVASRSSGWSPRESFAERITGLLGRSKPLNAKADPALCR